MENENDLVQINTEQQTDNAVKAVESYVLADVDSDFTYKNPSVADALKFDADQGGLTSQLLRVAKSSEAMNDLLVKDKVERTFWDKSVRVMQAMGGNANERSDLEIKNSELWYKKMLSDTPMNINGVEGKSIFGEFSNEDMYNLAESTTKLDRLPRYDENLAEEIASTAASSIGTMVKNVGVLPAVVGGTAGLIGTAIGTPVLGIPVGTYVAGMVAGGKLAFESYQQATGQVYGQLILDNPGGDKQRYRAASHGAGVINGALEMLFTKGVANKVPWIKGMLVNAAKIKNASDITKSSLVKIGEMAVSYGADGVTEMAQEISQVVADEYGRTGQVTLDGVFSNERMQQYLFAGTAGVATSAGLVGGLNVVGKVADVSYTEARKLGERGAIGDETKPKFKLNVKESDRAKSIKFQLQQDTLKQATEAVKSSGLQRKSETVYDEVLQNLHGDENLLIRNDKFKEIIANDQAKTEMIRKKMGIKVSDESELTSVSRDQMFKLLQLDEAFFNSVQFEADGPIQSEADKFFNKVKDNKSKAVELEFKINTVNDPVQYSELVNNLADLEEVRLDEFATVEDYVNQPVFPDSVKELYKNAEGVLSESLFKLEQDVRSSRKQVADIQVQAERKKIDKLVRFDVAVQKDMEVEELKTELKNYKVYDAIEAFNNSNYGKTEFVENSQVVFHGTRQKFENLDFTKSGGMIFTSDKKNTAEDYMRGSGGGRSQLSVSNLKFIDADTGEEIVEKLSNTELDLLLSEGLVYTTTDNDRVVKLNIDPIKTFDITSFVNFTKLNEIFSKIKTDEPQLNALKNSKTIEDLNYSFWSSTKYASRLPNHKFFFNRFVDLLKKEGYTSIKFNDDTGVTYGVFDNYNTTQNKYKINPNTLPENLKKYASDPKLKEYKVFGDQGIDAEDSAQLLGYDSVEQMFKDLLITEPRQKVINEQIESRVSEIRAQSEDEIGFKPDDIRQALSNASRMHLKELDKMMDSYKKSVKKGVKFVTSPIKTNTDLKIQAMKIVSSLKVKELNSKVFETNIIRMDRKARDYFLKGDIYNAIKFKQNAALNSLIQAEVIIANKTLNRKINKLSKAISNNAYSTLQKAGQVYVDAFDVIVETINFNRRFDTKTRDKWTAWKELQSARGEGNYELPSEFNDSRANVNNMSAQSALALVEAGLNIISTAERKEALISQRDLGNQVLLLNQVATSIGAKLQKRKDYDAKLFDTRDPKEEISWANKTASFTKSFVGIHTRMEEVIFRTILDKGQNNGYFSQLIWKPVEQSRKYESDLTTGLESYITNAIKEYGNEKFFNLGYQVIDDQDLKNTKYFKNVSKITKADVFVMALNFGNEGNIEALSKTLGLEPDQIIKIMERHLDESEIKLAQQHGLSYESLWTENVKTLTEMGEDIPEKVQGNDFLFKGKVIKGWYYPIAYRPDFLIEDLNIKRSEDENFKASLLTFNGHNEARLGASKKKEMNLEYAVYNKSIKQISHDVSFRVALRDLDLMFNSNSESMDALQIQKDLYNTLGKANYEALGDWLESIKDIPNQTTKGEFNVDRWVGTFIKAKQIASLGSNLGTVLMQTASLPIVYNRLREDYNGTLSYLDVSQLFTRSLINIFTPMVGASQEDVIAEIAKHSPDFANRLKQLDIQSNNADYGNVPQKGSRKWNKLNAAKEKLAFYALGKMSLKLNAATWITAHRLADSGKIKGVDNKSPQQVIDYANSVVRTELESNDNVDKSQVQRMRGLAKLFSHFYSQMNVITNKFIAAGYGAKIGWQDAEDLSFAKKYFKRSMVAAQLTNRALMIAVLPAIIVQGIRGAFKDEEDEKTLEEQIGAAVKGGAFQAVDSFLVLRDLSYFVQTDMKRAPTLPLYQTGADVVISLGALIDVAFTDENEDLELSKKQIDALTRTASLTGYPIKVMRQLYGLVTGDEDIFGIDSPMPLLNKMSSAVNGVKMEDFMKSANDDATTALEQGIENKDVKEEIEIIEKQTRPRSQFSNPEGNSVYLADVKKEIELSTSELEFLDKYMYVAAAAESMFDDNAVNKIGATGRYQFVQTTWKDLYKQYPTLLRTSTVTADPDLQNKAMWKLSGKNFYALTKPENALPATLSSMYALHMLGEGEGLNLVKASELQNVIKAGVSKDYLIANPVATLGVKVNQAKGLDFSKITVGQVRANIKAYLTDRINQADTLSRKDKFANNN